MRSAARNILANSRAGDDRDPRPAPFGADPREPPADPPYRLRHRLSGRHPALPRADPQPLVGPRSAVHRRRLRGRRHRRRARSTPAAASPGATRDQTLQVAATAIHDNDGTTRTDLGGIDVRYRPTRLDRNPRRSRGQRHARRPAATRRRPRAAPPWPGRSRPSITTAASTSSLMRASAQSGFGVGQLNASENGTRKIGIDARARLSETLSLTGSAWHEDYLGSDARRIAGRALIEYRGRDFSARAGLTIADDRLADGRSASSQILQLGATKRFFDNRLELDAQTELPIGGHSDSIDFPARHRLSARFAVNRERRADRLLRDRRRRRDRRPHRAARLRARALGGRPDRAHRQFPEHRRIWPAQLRRLRPVAVASCCRSTGRSISPLDGNRTLGGIDPARVLNPLHPVASGGFVGDGATLTEDFTAVTAGATYRAGPLEHHRPRRISRRRPRGPLRPHDRRASPDRRGPRRRRRASTGSPPAPRAAPRRAPPTSS